MAIEFDHLGPGDYDRAKRVLNRARHPGFVGRELYFRCATTGSAVIAREGAGDLGVSLIAKQKLQALSVVREAQGRGVGAALVAHTNPKWVNAIMERVPWFEKRGYRCVGAPSVGQSGKMATQLMERSVDAPTAVTITNRGEAPAPARLVQEPMDAPDMSALALLELPVPPVPTVDVARVCHPRQASLVNAIVLGPLRNVCGLAGRQSGKSFGGSALAPMLKVLATPGVNAIVVTATDASCEKMAFLPAVSLNRVHGLGGTPAFAAGDRSMSFANGSVVYYLGANNQKTIDRLRGTPNLVLCLIDEAGIYDPDTLAEMIKAVRPGLRPRRGTLCVMGTPSPAGKQGTWYDITVNAEYDQHRFDYRDNDRVPDFLDVERTIDEDLRAQFPELTPAEARQSAWFKREYLALFEVDLAEMVYQLAEENLVDSIPTDLDTFITGGDMGMSANDALVSLGWKESDPTYVYVVDQEEASGQDSIACADMVNDHNKKRHPISISMDPGALGQKTIKTVQRLYPDVPIKEAQKPPIGIQVRAVNGPLQSQRLRVKRGSKLALELARPTWVNGIVGGEIDEHGRHSDLVPALRYVCIAAVPYLPDVPVVQTAAEAELEKRAAMAARAERNRRAATKNPAADYDPEEFARDLMDDMYE